MEKNLIYDIQEYIYNKRLFANLKDGYFKIIEVLWNRTSFNKFVDVLKWEEIYES